MNRRTALGFGFLAPALLVVILFFLAPVVLTVFFAFTNMSTSTGIRGGGVSAEPIHLAQHP